MRKQLVVPSPSFELFADVTALRSLGRAVSPLNTEVHMKGRKEKSMNERQKRRRPHNFFHLASFAPEKSLFLRMAFFPFLFRCELIIIKKRTNANLEGVVPKEVLVFLSLVPGKKNLSALVALVASQARSACMEIYFWERQQVLKSEQGITPRNADG